MSKNRRSGVLFTPLFTAALIILTLIILLTVFASLIAPYDPDLIDLGQALQGSSLKHLFGTDQVGRDLFSRILFGGRTTLLGALGIVIVSAVIGVPLGMFAGYYRGWFDTLVLRISDIIISFPSLLLAFVFVAGFGRGLMNSVIAIGIIYVPMTAKLMRSMVMMEMNKTYVEAARSIGYSSARILFLEILPNCVSTLMAQLTLDIGYAILDLAAMSFIGLGVQPPTSDWGAMLEESRVMLFSNPGLAILPGLAIVITVISINLVSDGIQRYLDPAQRKVLSIRKLKKMGRIQYDE